MNPKLSQKGHILVGVEEAPEAVPDVSINVPETVPEAAAIDPPAVVDNWANPTDGGLERNTVYTFF